MKSGGMSDKSKRLKNLSKGRNKLIEALHHASAGRRKKIIHDLNTVNRAIDRVCGEMDRMLLHS